MKVIITISLLFLIGCAEPEMTVYDIGSINSEFIPYMEKFEDLFGIKVFKDKSTSFVYISFKSKLNNDSEIGVCRIRKSITGKKLSMVIHIKESFWFDSMRNGLEREALIFHELLHCLPELPHDSSIYSDGCPKNLMHPRIPSKWCLNTYYDEYINFPYF